MLEFIGELISESGKIHFTEQTDRRGNSTGIMFSVTFFLVAINGNGVVELIFADDLAIYITTSNQRVASRALQRVTNKLNA